MTVARLLDRIGAALSTITTLPASAVGTADPIAPADLPSLTLSMIDISHTLTGIGSASGPSRTGALRLDRAVDLADPVARFTDGSTAELLSPDRTTLFLPFGPVVTFDGSEVEFLTGDDLQVAVNGTAMDVVTTGPGSGEVRGDTRLGTVHFGDPLPAAGSVTLGFFIGEWEVTVDRLQGKLNVDVYAASSTEVDSLSRQADGGLVPTPIGTIAELKAISATSFGSIEPPDSIRGNARHRRLTYLVDAELEDLALDGGGGIIRSIDVTSIPGPEGFTIPPEENGS